MTFPPPPFGTVWDLGTMYWLSRCLHVVTEMGVADALGPEPATTDALAATVGANADALHRVLRLLASHGVFALHDGTVAHTPASELLRADHPQSMRAFVRLIGSSVMWDAYGELAHSVRTGHPAVEKVAPDGYFAYLAAHPDLARIFDEAMMGKAHAQIPAILGAYDFSGFLRIADIAGGRGHLLQAVLKAAPNAKGVLFEQPQVIADVEDLASDRLLLQAGDFFKGGLPVCDGYMLMQVLHDWDDESAAAILRGIREAAPAGARLLVIEMIMPDEPGRHLAKVLDIGMLTMHTGRERSKAEYARLFDSTRFRLERVVGTPSELHILEVMPA